ncbi:hypothetical protein COLO4_03322 [Corchorus olitorius]|uniref:Uncharacterized protein n=1 Tax=Corchorus olitorius TaxID=93759 RepID=A0A1R3KYY8_9ROSI|nr:hypothetical protein COLO4_03322 [Corchorus olitorius]
MENLKPNSEALTQSKSELPQEFIKVMEDIGGFDAKFVIQKRLSVADTNLPPCCLSIPLKAIKIDFLTDEEEESIDEYEIPVLCIDPSLNVKEMALSRDFPEDEDFSLDNNNQKNSQTAYKLTQNWHSVKERNGLKTSDLVKIWTFLIQDDDGLNLKRGFTLVKVEDGQPRPPKKKTDFKLKDDNHQKPKSKKEPKKIRPRK